VNFVITTVILATLKNSALIWFDWLLFLDVFYSPQNRSECVFCCRLASDAFWQRSDSFLIDRTVGRVDGSAAVSGCRKSYRLTQWGGRAWSRLCQRMKSLSDSIVTKAGAAHHDAALLSIIHVCPAALTAVPCPPGEPILGTGSVNSRERERWGWRWRKAPSQLLNLSSQSSLSEYSACSRRRTVKHCESENASLFML